MPKFQSPDAAALYALLTHGSVSVNPTPPDHGGVLNQLVLNISEGCNLGCTYCFADEGRYGKPKSVYMTIDIANAIIDQVYNMYTRLRYIKFFGGEPFLRLDVISAAASRVRDFHGDNATKFNAITNGTIASRAAIDIIRNFDISLTVSIDGPEEVHDGSRRYHNGRGTFRIVDQNVRKMIDDGCNVNLIESVYTPLHTAANISMLETYEFLRNRYPAARAVIVHPLRMTEGDICRAYPKEVAERYIMTLEDQALELWSRVFYENLRSSDKTFTLSCLQKVVERTHSEKHCDVGVNSLTASAKGLIYPCYVFSENEDFVIGDFTRSNAFEQRESSHGWAVLQNMRKDSFEACRSCDIKQTCDHCLVEAGKRDLGSTLPDLECSFKIRQTEALLLALNQMASDRFDLAELLSNFADFHIGIGGS